MTDGLACPWCGREARDGEGQEWVCDAEECPVDEFTAAEVPAV